MVRLWPAGSAPAKKGERIAPKIRLPVLDGWPATFARIRISACCCRETLPSEGRLRSCTVCTWALVCRVRHNSKRLQL